MEFLNALEDLALQSSTPSDDYAIEDVSRWAKLFHLTHAQAAAAIEAHLMDLSKLTISDQYWDMIRQDMESQGHDRMSYTYELAQKQRPVTQPPTPSSPRPKSRKRYLFKLAYPLDSAKKLQDLASLPETPEVLDDEEDTESRFVVVDDATRATIEAHMRGFSPIFTSLRTPADKNLSRTSLAPTLGIDPTIPQHRVDTSPSPAQDEYPVLYFFYGTLAEPERLVRELGLDELPTLAPAEIRRGRMRMAGKYRALVDGDEKDVVQGAMYVVGCREHEDVLRHYESDLYEVVRCDIFGEKGEMVKGLTFRFAGDAAMLK